MPLKRFVRHALAGGLGGGLLSAAMLLLGSRMRGDGTVAALNAPSHWFLGDAALRADEPSLRHTALGAATHQASAFFWSTLFAAWRLARAKQGLAAPATAARDAVLLTGIAAVVDLAVVPHRLTPGFERRLSRPWLTVVYLAFAAGLALGARVEEERQRGLRASAGGRLKSACGGSTSRSSSAPREGSR
jgi:hypothetical protein